MGGWAVEGGRRGEGWVGEVCGSVGGEDQGEGETVGCDGENGRRRGEMDDSDDLGSFVRLVALDEVFFFCWRIGGPIGF